MAVSNVWVFAEGAEGAPTSTTLELLTKARELAPRDGGQVGGAVTAFVAGEATELAVKSVTEKLILAKTRLE